MTKFRWKFVVGAVLMLPCGSNSSTKPDEQPDATTAGCARFLIQNWKSMNGRCGLCWAEVDHREGA